MAFIVKTLKIKVTLPCLTRSLIFYKLSQISVGIISLSDGPLLLLGSLDNRIRSEVANSGVQKFNQHTIFGQSI